MAEVNEAVLEAWEEKYKPIKNHIDPSSSWDGTMFETYGDEVQFVMSQPDENVWTWVDGDEGTWIISGLHAVNRIGYFVTEEKWETDLSIQVDTYGEE